MTTEGLPPLTLTGRQQFLSQSLAERNEEMGELYVCALRVIQDTANPRRFFLAAHSIREMTKDLPKVLDVPVLTDHGRMRDRLDALEKTLSGALASECHQAGAWTGEIDSPLRRLLAELPEFFAWRNESDPKMRDNATAMFRRIDPAGRPIPEPLEKRRAKRWITLHDYFNRTAHRSQTTEEEFLARLDELERILMDSLSPQPSEDFSLIDAIFAEDRADA